MNPDTVALDESNEGGCATDAMTKRAADTVIRMRPRKVVLILAFGLVLGSLANRALANSDPAPAPHPVHAHHEGYGQQVRAYQQALSLHDLVRAKRILRAMLRHYPDNPEIQAIALRMQCAQGDFALAGRLRRATRGHQPHAELAQALRVCSDQQAMAQAQGALTRGQPAEAIRVLTPLYPHSTNPYAVGILLARAYLADHQIARAEALYSELALRFPKDSDLARRARSLRQRLQLDAAEQHLSQGDAAGAIRLAAPLYPAGSNPYRAGLLLARAYMHERRLARAQQLYAELAQRFPQDPGLASLSVVLLAQMHRPEVAEAKFKALDAAQQQDVMAALGGNPRLLFAHAITLTGLYASSTGSYPDNNEFSAQLYTAIGQGAVTVAAQRAHRFGQYAMSYSIDVYQSLGDGYSGELAASVSPSATFLAKHSLMFALTKDLGTFSLGGGLRHLVYANTLANIVFARYDRPLTDSLDLGIAVFYVPETRAYSVMLAPAWHSAGGRLFAYVMGGTIGEQLGVNNAVVRVSSYSAKIGYTANVRPEWGLTGDVFYEHRNGLYNRTGGELAITKRW